MPTAVSGGRERSFSASQAHQLRGSELHPSPATGLLVVLPELVLDAGVTVGRQHAATAAIGVAVTLGTVATQVGVHSPADLEADLVLVARATPRLDPDPVLRLLVIYGDHFFRVP